MYRPRLFVVVVARTLPLASSSWTVMPAIACCTDPWCDPLEASDTVPLIEALKMNTSL